jgi:hypothetical protein
LSVQRKYFLPSLFEIFRAQDSTYNNKYLTFENMFRHRKSQRTQRLNRLYLACILLSANQEDSDEDSNTRMQRLEYRCCRDGRIPRGSLLMLWNSPWEMVLRSGNVQVLITLSGYDHQSFYLLHELFAPIFNSHSPYIHIGLSLVYYRTKGQTFTLCTIFGMTHTPLSLWFQFS